MFCACMYLYKFADYNFVSVGEIKNISYRIYSQVLISPLRRQDRRFPPNVNGLR